MTANGFGSSQNGGFAAAQSNVFGTSDVFTLDACRASLEPHDTFTKKLRDEVQTATIFAENIRAAANASNGGEQLFTQFGLLAADALAPVATAEMLYYNVAAPSSVFICGSQGSGKSHSLSCLLENSLFQSQVNHLPRPLTGIMFHFDTFVSDVKGSPCEAAYLSYNLGVKVRVLCAPTNIGTMKRTYAQFPSVKVEPLRLWASDLNTQRMMDLMAVRSGSTMPLYMHVVTRVLRDLRIEQQKTPGAEFDYRRFKALLMREDLSDHQRVPLDQRLDNLESFMATKSQPGNDWTAKPGQLTIVDLSCPCVMPENACLLFNICLALFLEKDMGVGRVVALDEAHKFMNDSDGCTILTDRLLTVIREQRHLAARVFISTQEPTISPKLLDLCNVTIVHRFTSPEWLRTLQKHLAGASMQAAAGNGGEEVDTRNIFAKIVELRVGEALLFAPSAIVAPDGKGLVERLGNRHITMRVRQRSTPDGGRSIMAG